MTTYRDGTPGEVMHAATEHPLGSRAGRTLRVTVWREVAAMSWN